MSLTYKIARLWGAPEGTVEKYTVNEKIICPKDKDLDFVSNFCAELQFIKLKDEISALLQNGSIKARSTCELCLEEFIQDIQIPSVEGEFFYEKASVASSEADLYFINKNKMLIDLNDLVRQEIILHFPLISVCSRSCKGLCAECGKNKNRQSCKCKNMAVTKSHMPFKNLKKLWNL